MAIARRQAAVRDEAAGGRGGRPRDEVTPDQARLRNGPASRWELDLFSSRNRAITPELTRLIEQYTKSKGHPPSKRTIWIPGQQAAQNTRRTKSEAKRIVAGATGKEEPTEAERLAGWERQVAREEMRALARVHHDARAYAAAHRSVPLGCSDCRNELVAEASEDH